MGYPTKVQVIRRKDSEQWYINFPAAIAQAMEFTKGETVEWVIQDRGRLLLNRVQAASEAAGKKKRICLAA
jgi:antitoxin component of MazEF toxin-antitoxin module